MNVFEVLDRLRVALASEDAGTIVECFRQHDFDGNGVVDQVELAASLDALDFHVTPMEVHAIFGVFDKSKNGVISYAELTSLNGDDLARLKTGFEAEKRVLRAQIDMLELQNANANDTDDGNDNGKGKTNGGAAKHVWGVQDVRPAVPVPPPPAASFVLPGETPVAKKMKTTTTTTTETTEETIYVPRGSRSGGGDHLAASPGRKG